MLVHPCGMRQTGLFRTRLAAATCAVGVALLAVSARGDVTTSGDVSPGNIPVVGGPVTADIIVGGAGTVTVLEFGSLTVDIPAFTEPLVSPNGFIAHTADSIGVVTVDGFLSEWEVQTQLVVGELGLGYLNVSAGAYVHTENTGASETIPDFVIGDASAVNSPDEHNAQGFVSITGLGTTVSSTFLMVGELGKGTLEMASGSRLFTLEQAYLGHDRDADDQYGEGRVVVDGRGTRWTINEELFVGDEGRGTLEIRNEGLVQVRQKASLGNGAGSNAIVAVTGLGSQFWMLEDLDVGSFVATTGTANLFVADGAHLRVDGNMRISSTSVVELHGESEFYESTVLLPFAGSVLTNDGVIRGSGRIEAPIVNNGYIRAGDPTENTREKLWITGSVTNNDNIEAINGEIEFMAGVLNGAANGDILAKDSVLRFNGGVANDGNLFVDDSVIWSSSPIVNGGLISVAAGGSNSQSHLFVDSLTLTSTSTFDVTVDENFSSQLTISGDLTLGGTLSITLADDYRPQVGDSYRILQADSITGTFAAISPSRLVSGLSWAAVTSGSDVFLRVVSGALISADFNGDGIVNNLDHDILLMQFGMAGGAAMGDANGDNFVDGLDLLIWQQQEGGPPPATAALSGVPEPATMGLAGAAATAWLVRRRRRG